MLHSLACLSVLLYRRVNGVGKCICCYHTGMKILNLCGLVFAALVAQPGLAETQLDLINLL